MDRQKGDLDGNNEKGKERGMHETWENRDACSARYRNEGLFIADQKPGARSHATRLGINEQANELTDRARK